LRERQKKGKKWQVDVRAGSGKGPDITYRPANIVAVVGNELTSNKGHIDKMVLIRGVQFINCHIKK
jgi:hypothetical protein